MLESRHADLVVHLVGVFMYTSAIACICAIAHMHDNMQVCLCTLTVCIYVYVKSVVENCYSLLHSLIGQSPLYREGLWPTGCVRKRGEENGRVEEGEGKKMETCLGDIRATRWGLFTYWKKKPMVGCFCMKGVKKKTPP